MVTSRSILACVALLAASDYSRQVMAASTYNIGMRTLLLSTDSEVGDLPRKVLDVCKATWC